MYKLDDLKISVDGDEKSKFVQEITSRWDRLETNADVFRYKIANLQEKVVGGKYLLQLNPNRSTNRRPPEQIDNICQPFNENKFNFTKVSPREILFSIERDTDPNLHMFLVNVSPISQYHTLLCPSLNKCLPQVVTVDSLELVFEIMFMSQDRDLRIGFNSLCGLASVNHLHYHLLMEKNTLAVENVKWKHLNGAVYCLEENYPAPAFCFEVENHTKSLLAKEIYKLIEYFLKMSIAHNILITNRSPCNKNVTRVFVWPRKSASGAKQLTAFNVAVCELSGWFPVYDLEAFKNLQAVDLESELRKWKIDNFETLAEEIKYIL